MSDVKHNLGGKFERREIKLSTGPVSYFVGGDGPVYLHLHGAGGLRVSPAVQNLTEHYRVIMPLIPGFDGTPLHEEVNSFPELAHLIAEFIDQEIGETCDISSHAFSGRLGLWFAVLHPDKIGQLIVQCPSGFRPDGQTILPTAQYEKGVITHMDRVPDEERSRKIIDANRDAGYSYHAPGKGVVDKNVFRDHDLVERLGNVECLTLILQGTRDAVLPPDSVQFLRSKISRSNLIYVYDAGHLIEMDQPKRFVDLVHDFLTRSEAFIVNPGDAALGMEGGFGKAQTTNRVM